MHTDTATSLLSSFYTFDGILSEKKVLVSVPVLSHSLPLIIIIAVWWKIRKSRERKREADWVKLSKITRTEQ